MKIKEIYVEAKRSKNYQTHTVGRTITLEEGDNPKTVERQQQFEVNKQAKDMLLDVK